MITLLSPPLPPPSAPISPSTDECGEGDGLFLRALGAAEKVEAPAAEEEDHSGDEVCAEGEAAPLSAAGLTPPPPTAPAEAAEVTGPVSRGPMELPGFTAKGFPPAPPSDPASVPPPPSSAASDGINDQSAPSGPAAAAGASESALRFRLADADGPQPYDSPAPAAPAETTGPAELAAAAQDQPSADSLAADLPPSSVPADPSRTRPAAAPPPHHQAAAHLSDLIRAHAADVASAPGRTELVLSPEELGRIRFDLRSSPDGLSVTLSADRPETLELLRRHATELRAELSAAGYDLASLDFGTSGGTPENSATQASGAWMPDEPAVEQSPPPAPSYRRSMSGGLDLRL